MRESMSEQEQYDMIAALDERISKLERVMQLGYAYDDGYKDGIATERERCAKVAEAAEVGSDGLRRDVALAKRIAAAIRKGE
jgi:hypothetical protein